MPLQKIVLKPGVNRENTRYTNEGGYYESEKVRFRQGTPEKIGGWLQISTNVFIGICRSLWNWTTLIKGSIASANLVGVGTEAKFYITQKTATSTDNYYDITPIVSSHILSNPPIATVNLSYTVTVTDSTYHPYIGNYVIFSGMATVNNVALNGQYQVTSLPSATTYTVTALQQANATGTGGGAVAYAAYLLNVGNITTNTATAWGVGAWGVSTWGGIGSVALAGGTKLWTQYNFGENLLFGPKLGAMYMWNATTAPVLASPTVVTISNGSPALVTLTTNTTAPIPDGTALMFETTGTPAALPLGLAPFTIYYVRYLTSTTFNLSAASTVVYPFASCSGAGANTLTVTSVTGTLVAGMTIYYPTGTNSNQLSLGTLSFTGTGSGGIGTYSVSAGVSVAATTMGAVTVLNTTSAGSGVQTISIRAVPVSSLTGAASVPLTQNTLAVSDASRFTFAFGTNDYLSTTFDPMLVRWSDQESMTNWVPSITSQSGSIRLSHGSEIRAVLQSRQEILVYTDAAVYSMQYLGAPYVWSTQLLSDNISIVSINAAAYSNGTAFWMGQDKFYKYDGRVQALRCDLRQFIYDDIDRGEFGQIFASTNEGFNEVWWFYCTKSDNLEKKINRYVVYNYVEDIWYYGSMNRTAWLDSSLRDYPIAATYSNNLVYHENGVDDGTVLPATAIASYIQTSQFDIGDGHNFAFVWRMLPDLTFRGSVDGTTPSLLIQLEPLQNSGSGYNSPLSVGGTNSGAFGTVTATQVYPISLDTFTGQLNIRVRGRQMSMRIICATLGTQWQMGAPRIDIRPDGRRGG